MAKKKKTRRRKVSEPDVVVHKHPPKPKKDPLRYRDPANGLTPREEIFAAQYVENLASRARGAVGKAAKAAGCAPATGTAMLKRPQVVRAINENLNAYLESEEINTHMVLREIKRIAHSDLRNLYHEDGTLKDIHELDESTAAAIQAAEIDNIMYRAKDADGGSALIGFATKYKMYSKIEALKLLMQYLGLLDGNGGKKNEDRLEEIVNSLREPNAKSGPVAS